MLELLQDVLPWLFAFYLIDGLVHVRPGQVFLVGNGASRFRLLSSGLRLSAWVPGAEVYAADSIPFVLGSEALHVRSGPRGHDPTVLAPSDLAAIPWPPPEGIEARRCKIVIGGREIYRAPSESHALALADELKRVAAARPASRTSLIRELVAERLSLDNARAERIRETPLLLKLRVFGTLAFVGWFVFLPVIAFGPPVALLFLPFLLGALGLIHAGALASAFALLRRSSPNALGRVLWQIALLPPAGARIVPHASRESFARYDGATLALLLLPESERASFWRRHLRRAELECSRFRGTDLQPYFAARQSAWESAKSSIGTAEPWPKRDSDGATFCPVCDAQFRQGFELCSDCGVELHPFPLKTETWPPHERRRRMAASPAGSLRGPPGGRR